MAKGDFGGKRNTAGFDKNPNNINSTGLNRKSFASINKELIIKGIEPLSKIELLKTYSLIFNATEVELKEIEADNNTPYALNLIIKELTDLKTRSKAFADCRDWIFGKAPQKVVEITSEREDVTMTPDEQLAKLEELKIKIEQTKKDRIERLHYK